MNRQRKYREEYEHTLDSMFKLFKYGRTIEIELEEKLKQSRDELIKISNICAGRIGGSEDSMHFEEIKSICNQSLDMSHNISN